MTCRHGRIDRARADSNRGRRLPADCRSGDAAEASLQLLDHERGRADGGGGVADLEKAGELLLEVRPRRGTFAEAEAGERFSLFDAIADGFFDEEAGCEVDRVLPLPAPAADVDREKTHLLRPDRAHEAAPGC